MVGTLAGHGALLAIASLLAGCSGRRIERLLGQAITSPLTSTDLALQSMGYVLSTPMGPGPLLEPSTQEGEEGPTHPLCPPIQCNLECLGSPQSLGGQSWRPTYGAGSWGHGNQGCSRMCRPSARRWRHSCMSIIGCSLVPTGLRRMAGCSEDLWEVGCRDGSALMGRGLLGLAGLHPTLRTLASPLTCPPRETGAPAVDWIAALGILAGAFSAAAHVIKPTLLGGNRR